MTAAEILDEAAALWASSRKRYRDETLRVGRLLHDYVLAWLREAEALPQDVRNAKKLSREYATKTAADRLGVTGARINSTIHHAMIVVLLSNDGDCGGLSLSAVRYFRVLVRRRRCKLTDARANPSDERPDRIAPSGREVWEVLPRYAETGPELFRRAARESWKHDEVRSAVALLTAKSAKAAKASESSPRRDPSPTRIHGPERVDLRSLARVAAPRDLAEMIVSMISEADDPGGVLDLVVERLPDFRRAPAITLTVEED